MHPSLHTSQWAAGPSTHSRTYATALQEQDSLFHSYEHLTGVPNSNEGLTRLRKIASMVKPIMRKRGWQVQVLTEFMPDTPNLLGLNINKGYKICVRLRYSHNPGLFISLEETVDTMLHELSHIVWGPHDGKFHALWDELRDEHETLLLRGYTGEGFLTKGNRLGGGRIPPQSEIRRLARENAEKRRVLQKSSGRRVGGTPLGQRTDIRQVIADAAERRNKMDRGCASGTADAGRLADQASRQTFKTKAEEDDANDRAIAEALLELMEEDEARKMQDTFSAPAPHGGLAWTPEKGLYSASEAVTNTLISEEEQMKWALEESTRHDHHAIGKRNVPMSAPRSDPRDLKRSRSQLRSEGVLRFRDPEALQNRSSANSTPEIGSRAAPINLNDSPVGENVAGGNQNWTCEVCTCINPMQFLACDACGVERSHALAKAAPAVKRKPVPPPPPPKEIAGWYCRECATLMEHKWWTCSGCGLMKDTS